VNGNSDEQNGRAALQWVGILAVSGTLGAGSAWLVPQLDPSVARPDPFTGTDGRELEQRLNKRIDGIDTHGTRQLAVIEARLSVQEAGRSEVLSRLARIEELVIDLRVRLGAERQSRP